MKPEDESAPAQWIQEARTRIPSNYVNQERPQFATLQTNICTPSYMDRVGVHNPKRRSQYENVQGSRTNQDLYYFQSESGSVLEYYFKDRKFTGAPKQSVGNLIGDFKVCSVQQSLDLFQNVSSLVTL